MEYNRMVAPDRPRDWERRTDTGEKKNVVAVIK
jgi:hypothetical protein